MQTLQHNLLLLLIAVLIQGVSAEAIAVENIAVYAKTIHPVSGPVIQDGVIYVGNDGRIMRIGPQATTDPPSSWNADFQRVEAEVVTPGLIDAHTVVGLAGQYNYDHDQDQLERSNPIQPQLRALDAFNVQERLVLWARSLGVTTIHTGHAPGELVSGQTVLAKTHGTTSDEAIIKTPAALALTLAQSARKSGKASPGNRSKMMSMLRQEFIRAAEYAEKGERAKKASDKPAKNLSLEMLAATLRGDLPVLITAHTAQDIINALRLAKEFGLNLILDGAAEAYLVVDEIKAAGVPVLVHPTMARASGERKNLTYENAAILDKAGIPIAIQSGYESYVPKTRIILFEAAIAAVNGLGTERALRSITLGPAMILGIDDELGSLEAGKQADMALFDGDPFEYTTHCIGTIIGGQPLLGPVR